MLPTGDRDKSSEKDETNKNHTNFSKLYYKVKFVLPLSIIFVSSISYYYHLSIEYKISDIKEIKVVDALCYLIFLIWSYYESYLQDKRWDRFLHAPLMGLFFFSNAVGNYLSISFWLLSPFLNIELPYILIAMFVLSMFSRVFIIGYIVSRLMEVWFENRDNPHNLFGILDHAFSSIRNVWLLHLIFYLLIYLFSGTK